LPPRPRLRRYMSLMSHWPDKISSCDFTDGLRVEKKQ